MADRDDDAGEPQPGSDVLATWEAEWLGARPEWRLIPIFFRAARAQGVAVGEQITLAWFDALRHPGDPPVAIGKLSWWLDEIARFEAGAPRHPLTKAWRDEAIAVPVVARAAVLLLTRLLALLETPAPASVAAMIEQWTPPAAAARALESALADVSAAPTALDEPAGRARAAVQLLDALRDFPRFAAPAAGRVPLALLARHAVDRGSLATATEDARADGVLLDLAVALESALAVPAALPLDAARVAVARQLLKRLRAAPAAWRRGDIRFSRIGLPLALWRAARRSHATVA